MVAPAHTLARNAEFRANDYTDRRVEELLKRIIKIEKDLRDAKFNHPALDTAHHGQSST